MESIEDLRKRRISLGIRLGDLARAVGRSDATISRIERGQIRPSYELVQRIVRYLDEHEHAAAPHLTAGDVMNRSVVTVDAGATLAETAHRLERGGFSQLPVVDVGRVTGSVSEATILRALARPSVERTRVRDLQEPAYPQVDESFPADLLTALFSRYPAVVVTRRADLVGIVTKIDLIRGLRGTSLRRPPGTS